MWRVIYDHPKHIFAQQQLSFRFCCWLFSSLHRRFWYQNCFHFVLRHVASTCCTDIKFFFLCKHPLVIKVSKQDHQLWLKNLLRSHHARHMFEVEIDFRRQFGEFFSSSGRILMVMTWKRLWCLLVIRSWKNQFSLAHWHHSEVFIVY